MEIEVGLVEQTTNYTVELSSQDNTMNVSLGNVTTLKGDKGDKGDNGLSAYEIALGSGYEGTEEEWLESLKANYDDTELTNRITELEESTMPIERGGTGGATATEARTNLEVMKTTVLYENSSGTNGTITLSESVANFSYVEIFFKGDGGYYASQKIQNPDSKNAHIFIVSAYGPTNSFFAYTGVVLFSGTSVLWKDNADSVWITQISSTNEFTNTLSFDRALYVYKIIGYNY